MLPATSLVYNASYAAERMGPHRGEMMVSSQRDYSVRKLRAEGLFAL